MSMDHLIILQFSRARVVYTAKFEIMIDGPLWPRELRAAMKIIEIYKEDNKITKVNKSNLIPPDE